MVYIFSRSHGFRGNADYSSGTKYTLPLRSMGARRKLEFLPRASVYFYGFG